MGCRTRVIGNVYDPSRQVCNDRGNLSFTTINLPRLGIKAKGDLSLFFESLDTVYNTGYDLRGENAEGLLSDAGVSNSAWPWNDQAFHAMEMVYLGCGAR